MRTTPASRSTAPIARGRVTWVHREPEEAEMVERKRTDQLPGYQERENCRRARDAVKPSNAGHGT